MNPDPEPGGTYGLDGPAGSGPAAEGAASTLALRKRLFGPHPFRRGGVVPLAVTGLLLVGVLALLPVLARLIGLAPGTQHAILQATERLTSIGALLFLIAAPGYWLRLGHRALAVGALVVGLVYAGIAGLGNAEKELLAIAVVVAFLVFALAGFILVFILEDLIYTAHRRLPHARRALDGAPFAVLLAQDVFLPWWPSHAGLSLPSLWVASLVGTGVLALWWFIRFVNHLDRRGLVLRELHLLLSGVVAAAAVADFVGYIVGVESLVPTFLAYIALLGTWVYVSWSTLQRTHILLPGSNALPWAAVLLAGTFAIVSHLQFLYFEQDPLAAVTDVFRFRMAYMIFGIWLGVAFYTGRGALRALRAVTRLRTMPDRGRRVAAGAVRVAQGVRSTERAMGQVARGLYLGLDRALPGRARRQVHGWVVDGDSVQVLDDEE